MHSLVCLHFANHHRAPLINFPLIYVLPVFYDAFKYETGFYLFSFIIEDIFKKKYLQNLMELDSKPGMFRFQRRNIIQNINHSSTWYMRLSLPTRQLVKYATTHVV